MYQAIPYMYSSGGGAGPWLRPAETAAAAVVVVKKETKAEAAAPREVERAVSESPVVVVGRRACCLSHVVKRLLQGLGVNPAVHEVDDEAALAGFVPAGEEAALPAVFVGGKLLGGLDRLMAVHISGELVPILKKAGALWL